MNNPKARFSLGKTLLCSLAALGTALPAFADDTDVFKSILSNEAKPNIMFVLDYSGSMQGNVNNQYGGGYATSKIAILQNAVSELVDANQDSINAGIASLYKNNASGVKWPAGDLAADAHTLDPNIPVDTQTNADVIKSLLGRLDARNSTATVNALAEAAAYYRGDPVLHNDANPNSAPRHRPDVWNATNQRYSGGNAFAASPTSYLPRDAFQSASNTWQGAEYETPITDECQQNFIVLVSDGQPTSRQNTQTVRTALGTTGYAACEDLSTSIFQRGADRATTGNCGPEIVRRMATEDVRSDVPGSRVKTYTVGFSLEGPGKEYLRLLANEGRGQFYEATDAAALADALNNVINDITEGGQSFAELAIDIDRDSFSHDNRTFFSLFSPSGKAGWEGNIKGYFIDSDGLVDTNGAPATVTENGVTRFSDVAQSFWSRGTDGNETELGGVSELLTNENAAPRNLYTYTGDTANIPAGGIDLSSNADYLLSSQNQEITASLMGLSNGSAARDASLDWLQRASMGDALHSKPIIVTYANRVVVFAMTNQGFIHAFDASRPLDTTTADHGGGAELFAYMPKELLDNVPQLFEDRSALSHVYGLDGAITPWHDDTNNDGIVNNNEDIQLVFGMRRGGNSYYSLDVSDVNSPVLKWQIDGGQGDFANLAQTWSRASLVSVNDAGSTGHVLMFGGGYDAAVVDNTTAATQANGNAIFMVDENGELIWSMNDTDAADMVYSIASDMTIIDSDTDGLADRLYVGDQGGQVWRVDFDNVRSSGQFEATRFANLSSGSVHRPIFYAPSVALNRVAGDDYLSVSVGTGDRTDPLSTTSGNGIFMLRDEDIEKGAPASNPLITDLQIYDATSNDIASTDPAVRDAALTAMDNARGWAVYLNVGEKVLARPVSFEGKLFVTTFEPGGPAAADSCSFSAQGRLYIMSLRDARPIEYLSDGSESSISNSPSARITDLKGNIIPTKPLVVMLPDSQVQAVVGKESFNIGQPKVNTVFWHAK